ncbi:unnamed protein product [Chironomus riparius]|uniref:Odorant receptor n=1 Tax=Chironomus riparius TaxID=315576 RepID=A0A9N9RYR3_9DIPT|nr:unnamed protein product [Chironomus riparius]
MESFTNRIEKGFQNLKNLFKCNVKQQTKYNNILYEEFFRCEKTAQILGFKFLKSHKSLTNTWIRANNIAFEVAIIILLMVEIVSFVMSIRRKLFLTSIDNALFYGGFFVVAVKIYLIFYRNRAKLDQIIEKLDEHFPHHGVDQHTFKAQKYLNTLKRFEAIYYVIFLTTGLQFWMMPYLHQLYGTINSINVDWMTVYALTLPFNQLQPVVYEVMWMLEGWIFMCTIFYIICTDLLFASLCEILAMEFDILGQAIRKIDMNERENDAIMKLKKLVGIHQELIEVSKKLDEIFSPLLLINIFGSITTLCTAGFLLASGINGYFVAKYFIFPLCLTMQIFSHCHFSQHLIDSSTSIATSAYNSDWFKGNVEFRRLILQVMTRAQNAQKITGWKFFDVSLETFQWVNIIFGISHSLTIKRKAKIY